MTTEQTATNRGTAPSMGQEPGQSIAGYFWIPVLVLIAVYLPALIDLVADWYHDDNYSHGFLIPLVSGYLLWRKRDQLSAVPKTIDNRGLGVVVVGMIMFVLANGAAEYFVLRLSFVVTLFGLVWYLMGPQIVRFTLFEIALLLFMIPIPYVIYYSATFPMQLLASKITVFALNLLGAGAVRQGNIIILAGQSLEVAEACSGIRSLMSLLALGFIWAHLSQSRFAAKAILFLSVIPIAVVANSARVLVTSVLAYAATPEVTNEPWHSLMGMVTFAVAIFMLLILSAILRRVWP
jgi:exosortase